ncbi:facilitated trehalose transporter Tret1-like [Pollicipes pollicipes]|uniref:facilitated trehalose transporter Tret1-like n=1 Tax=Pollicipes pollicipes TaxID=41117 RepID=UPI0018859FEA|nr:facilitated trehalose transporter Tret1-like [Pollicipes pollicipes]
MTSSTLELIYSPKSSSYITQVLATLAVSMGPLAVGLGKGYSSPALASLAGPASLGGLAISPEEGSWVASLSLLGALVGGLPAGLALRLGRRRVLAAVALPFAGAWWLAAGAGSVRALYAAAFVSGLCSAVVALVTPVYVSEIAQPRVRGGLCAVTKVASNAGMLLSFSLGGFLDWRQLALVASAGPLLLVLACCAVPETPSFLLFRGREREAQKFSGVNAFSFYAVPILSKTFARTSAHGAAVVVCLLQILAGLTSGVLIDTVGRLPLLAVSSALMSLALAGFGTFVYVVDASQLLTDGQQAPLDWIPMSCVLVFQVAFSLGVGPISWLLIGELFPLRHRGLGAFATSVSYGCAFVSVKTFVDLERALGLHGVFWLYAAVSALCLVFVLAWVPETRGKELPEMERTGC